jgi:flagellar FliJ protein
MTTTRRFPLDVVLRVREVRERLSRGGMARAQVEEIEAQDRVDAAQAVLESNFVPQVADPQTFIAAFSARQSVASQVRALEVLREIRRDATVEATAAWRLTEQDRAGVQKLADRHRDTVVADDLAAEQHALDDVRRRPADDADEVER